MVWRRPGRFEHGWFLELSDCLAKGQLVISALYCSDTGQLLIPWRFFRLWALLDGVDPPENMIRCVANNYSTLGFWKSWHRSYNLWVVRWVGARPCN